jgi:hypothetical protein
MRRRNVREFISADALSIRLTRAGAPIPSEAGGYKPNPNKYTLEPQMFRIVQNKRRFNPGIVNSEAGDIPHTDYLLLGIHTVDVEKEDSFVWNGENFKVVGIHGLRKESLLATIDYLGAKNRDG